MQLGFAKGHSSYNPTQKKKWAWHLAKRVLYSLGFLFDIIAMAAASDFKFGIQLAFAN